VTSPSGHQGLCLAFCLYKYFSFGGLQRDFVRIASELQRRGHQIRVYTLSWSGTVPEAFDVVIVPVKAFTNHHRYELYSEWVQEHITTNPVDGVVGINKMPGLDVYYAADSCYEEKARTQRSWLYRKLPRYHHFADYERAVFGEESDTRILMISRSQLPFFTRHYQTSGKRLHFLPPGIDRDRIAPPEAEKIREDMRQELGIKSEEHLLLMVGSGFKKKGLDRAMIALAALPEPLRELTKLIVIGEDKSSSFKRLAERLGIDRQVTIFSGRDDVPRFLQAADLLIHPALDENAGIILLEAVVAGLPVLATENCGYAHYILEAGAGLLAPHPYDQKTLNTMLSDMLISDHRERWRDNGIRFSRNANIYSLHREAADEIEEEIYRRIQRPRHRGTLAFSLFKYFPYGGLQRDFLKIALACQARGYHIRVYTLSWVGDLPDGFNLRIVPASAMTNHKKYQRFSEWVMKDLEEHSVDGLIGFNKMPNLDVYYAADACYEDKAQTQRSWLYRQTPRYHYLSRFERAVFKDEKKPLILMISESQKPVFQQYYGTKDERFHLLPPGVDSSLLEQQEHFRFRQEVREELDVGDADYLLLMVGSGFVTKGLDRSLLAVAALPEKVRQKVKLCVIGEDNSRPFVKLVSRLKLIDQVCILRGRDDIHRFLAAADLLLHPAYIENTGTILLEAIVTGLPVVATSVCGYAHYISEADAGVVLDEPFDQEAFNGQVLSMLTSPERQHWQANGIRFGQWADIYSMPERAADLIVQII